MQVSDKIKNIKYKIHLCNCYNLYNKITRGQLTKEHQSTRKYSSCLVIYIFYQFSQVDYNFATWSSHEFTYTWIRSKLRNFRRRKKRKERKKRSRRCRFLSGCSISLYSLSRSLPVVVTIYAERDSRLELTLDQVPQVSSRAKLGQLDLNGIKAGQSFQ